MKVLITGGAGFIGSTIASACRDAGHQVVILDDLSTGTAAATIGSPFFRGDFAHPDTLRKIFTAHPDITVVVHCAAHIMVSESVREPLRYWRNNVGKTIELLTQMLRHGCTRLLFSSSAAIYASPRNFVVTEGSPIAPSSPYGHTKVTVEQILADSAAADRIRSLSLRYFNPVGADPQYRSGRTPSATGHALGMLVKAKHAGAPFTIYGTDWPTRDGTPIRDYVHVWDLAQAHVLALERFDMLVGGASRYQAVNLGSGTGTTIRELISEFQRATGYTITVLPGPRRPGDTAGAYTCIARADRLLGWRPRLGLDQAIRDELRWAAIASAVGKTPGSGGGACR